MLRRSLLCCLSCLSACSSLEAPLLEHRSRVADATVGLRDAADLAARPPSTSLAEVTSLQYQLTGTLALDAPADLFVIDLFAPSEAELSLLHGRGRHVVAYMSAGSWEPFRPDAAGFPPATLGDALVGYPNELWLDVRAPEVRARMAERMELAAARGFDGVVLTSVDAYRHATGFSLTAGDQLDYNLWLADQAHGMGLWAGIFGDFSQAEQLAKHYDFAMDTGCLAEASCERLQPYRTAGRAVFDLEIGGLDAELCRQAQAIDLVVTFKQEGYGAWYESCP